MNAVKSGVRQLVTTAPTKLVIGAVVTLLFLGFLIFKPQIQTFLTPGDTIHAEFSRNYQLFADQSKVKLGDLDIGVVSGIEPTARNTVMVTMKIDGGNLAKLGPAPTASIEPVTILGGLYTVNLTRGGGAGGFPDGGTIPLQRTASTQELDRILEALPSSARTSMQRMLKNTHDALAAGAGDAIDRLAKVGPPDMTAGGRVFDSALGTRPDQDLQSAVHNLDNLSRDLTAKQGQMQDIVGSLRQTTDALRAEQVPVHLTLRNLPDTLRATDVGMRSLNGSLVRLTDTAPDLRDPVKQLSPLLKKLSTVLPRMRPLVRELGPTLHDARPLVDRLVPTSDVTTQVFDDVRGPVIRRIEGPVSDTLLSNWRGSGPFAGDGAGPQANQKLYQAVGYLASNVGSSFESFDKNSYEANFHLGIGTTTPILTGTPADKLPIVPDFLREFMHPNNGPNPVGAK